MTAPKSPNSLASVLKTHRISGVVGKERDIGFVGFLGNVEPKWCRKYRKWLCCEIFVTKSKLKASLAVWRNLLPHIFQGGLQSGSPSRRAAPDHTNYLWFLGFTNFNVWEQHCSGKFCSVQQRFCGPWWCRWKGRPLQGTFKCLCYNASAQTWVMCCHTCRHNVKPWFYLFSSCALIRRSFWLSRSPMYWRLCWQNLPGPFRQTFALIAFSIKSKNIILR